MLATIRYDRNDIHSVEGGAVLTVGDLLPSLNDLPGPDPTDLAQSIDLDRPTSTSLCAAVDAIGAAQNASCQDNDLEKFQRVSKLILTDIVRAREIGTHLAAEWSLDFLAFMTATVVADATLRASDGGRAFEWWARSLADEYQEGTEQGLGQIRLVLWKVLPNELREFAAEITAIWIAGFYWHSWTFGEYVGVAGQLFAAAAEIDGAIAEGLVSDLVAARSIIFRAQWALQYRRPDVANFVERLENMLDNRNVGREAKADIAMFFALTDSPLTAVPQDQRAVAALDRYSDLYTPDQQLALMISACWGRIDYLLDRLDVLCAVAREASRYRANCQRRPTDELFNKSVQYARIGPAVRVLAEGGHSDDAVKLIAAWHGLAEDDDLLRGAVIGLSALAVNTRWCHGAEVLPAPEQDEDVNSYGDLDEVTSAIGAFLGMTITNSSNPTFRVLIPERPGIPDLGRGAAFDATATEHLRFDALGQLLQSAPNAAALVAIPGAPLPIQPLMLRETGAVLPLSVSLQQPRRCRPILRAAVIGGETTTSEWECSAVISLLRSAGIHVAYVDAATRDKFGELYVDDDLDLLWITGHGDHNTTRPDQSMLLFKDEEAANMDWLASLDARTGDRRLLVLNVCSGGRSTMHGSPYGFGIAPALAGPSQTVISHLWPTTPAVAAAFGVTLADALARGADHVRAFASALNALSNGPDQLIDALRASPGDGPRLADHLSLSSYDLDNIAHWGSPTLHI
jgi:hypothetical protein